MPRVRIGFPVVDARQRVPTIQFFGAPMGIDYSGEKGVSAAELLYLLPLSRANRIVDEHSFGLVARVDPDHSHRLIRFIDEAVRLSLGNQSCVAAAERVTSAGDETCGTAFNDGNRLVVEVRVARQRSSRSKTTVSAANAL